jgi:hypothetical protein
MIGMPAGTRIWIVAGVTDMRRYTPAQLSMLLEGIDWRQPVRTQTPQLAV